MAFFWVSMLDFRGINYPRLFFGISEPSTVSMINPQRLDQLEMIPSLKLTASLHLKMDGWKTIASFWDPAYFQGRTVSFREGNDWNPKSCRFSLKMLFLFWNGWFSGSRRSFFQGVGKLKYTFERVSFCCHCCDVIHKNSPSKTDKHPTTKSTESRKKPSCFPLYFSVNRDPYNWVIIVPRVVSSPI